jgi:ABC-type Fe3+/spermidine/putrescine transport system ATPase subunit
MELADRIAVMRDGRIEQVDPPSEIYLNPRTLHVARFIGGMNETDVSLRDGRATWHGINLPLRAPDGAYRGLSRPEDLETAPQGAPFRVERSVDLGAAIRLQMRSNGGDAVSWVTARAAAPDVGTTVSLRPRRLLLYRNDQLVSAATPHLDLAR